MTDRPDVSVPEQGGRTTRFLVVDDAREVRWLVGILLEDVPTWTVAGEAGDGAQAIARARELHPDVVLLDMSMPVMDGLEALPELRCALPEALIVLLTAFPVADVVEIAQSFGADACLDKVDMATELVPALQRLVGACPGARVARPGRVVGPGG
jgi:CheY-like chemotaxis protein